MERIAQRRERGEIGREIERWSDMVRSNGDGVDRRRGRRTEMNRE